MKAGLDPIKFGTSGWRARMADTYTLANVRRLTRAIADHLKETGKAEHGVVVGYDTRFRLYVEAPDARTLEALRDAARRHCFA